VASAEPANSTRAIRTDVPHESAADEEARSAFAELLAHTPIPSLELPGNLPLYLRREVLADILVMNDLYRRLIGVPGVLMEFGSRWGRHLALLAALRELYEPYDYTRRIIGFDTFCGFPDVHANDGSHREIHPGSMSVSTSYVDHLRAILEAHETESFNAHIRRFDVVEGDVRTTLPRYLSSHPETVIGLAYFDLDLYEPTRTCLDVIRPRLGHGSIVAFDQLGHRNFPGETVALLETFGLSRVVTPGLRFSRDPAFFTMR
jgi:hypothetical protein